MDGSDNSFVLTGAHVVDPAQGIDGIADVAVANGKIVAVGPNLAQPGTTTVDLTGNYLTPGWIDIHVHAYGTLGFGDPDSIGICQGVTSFVDAGGTGIDTLEEFAALLDGQLITSLYAGPTIRPIGIVGLSFIDDEVRALRNIPIAKWLDWVEDHPGMLRFVKCGAYSPQGRAPLTITKGIAEMLGLPLYLHIGEYQVEDDLPSTVEHAFKIAEAGDIVTHLYHNNRGRLIDEDGKLFPFVVEAQKRGVLFDVGFGAYNFSWDVAEKAYAQGLIPHCISSDLQQFNVCSPVYSLANVMSICMRLGMSFNEVIAGVTAKPASALSLTDRAGSLRAGLPADITVFRVEKGEFDLADCYQQKRKAGRRFVPVTAFKAGHRYDSDLTRAQAERNWFMHINEEAAPVAAARLTSKQVGFLAALTKALAKMSWSVNAAREVDLEEATAIQETFHATWRAEGVTLREALHAVYDCFIDDPFTMQIGLFFVRLEKPFVMERLNAVISSRTVAA